MNEIILLIILLSLIAATITCVYVESKKNSEQAKNRNDRTWHRQ